jgi:hypothetical protein
MMVAVGGVAVLIYCLRPEPSRDDIVFNATAELQRLDRSFQPEKFMVRAYKVCGTSGWTVEFFPAGSHHLVGLVKVWRTGKVTWARRFTEEDRVGSSALSEDLPPATPGRSSLQ